MIKPDKSASGSGESEKLVDSTTNTTAREQRRQDALLIEYGEVCNTFRMLTDIRFKLLAFLPIAAAAAAALKEGGFGSIGLAVSLFGLVVTIGLATYNERNDQLYDELVGRAADIERSLNIPDGAFANRPRPWLSITLPYFKEWKIDHRTAVKEWKIDHRTAVTTIYAASIALWLFGVMISVLEYWHRAYAGNNLFAAVIAIVVTYSGGRLLKSQKEKRSDSMKHLASEAAKEAALMSLFEAANNERLIKICAQPSEGAKNLDEPNLNEKKKVQARANFYATLETSDPDRLRYYLSQESEELAACYLVGLLTDLPPRWIYDCRTNRKGALSDQEEPEPWYRWQYKLFLGP